MTLFSNILGMEKTITLAAANPEGARATTANSGFIGDRVAPQELENSYIYDPIVFNSINKSVQTIMAADYELKAKNPTIRNFFIEFMDSIGNVGEDTTFDELLAITYQNQMIHGKHFIEIVYNKEMTKIVDLVCLNPKQIDYARDSSQKIVVDSQGRPFGYVQNLPWGVNVSGKGDTPPARVSLTNNQIFLRPERIAHFKLYTIGGGYDSIGIIEPAYNSIVRRQKIEEAQTNSIYARGTYPIIDRVGSPEVYPTQDMITSATQNLAKIQHNRYFAVPYWHDIKPLEVKQSEIVDQTIKMLRENTSAALGMPLAFATGSGEATNRATLTNQQTFLEYSLKDVVKRTLSGFKKYIFKRIADLEGFKEVPEIVWGDIGAEDKTDKAKRLTDYAKNSILLPADIREYAIRSEGLDVYIDPDTPVKVQKPVKSPVEVPIIPEKTKKPSA